MKSSSSSIKPKYSLDLGEPEMPYIIPLLRVFKMTSAADSYDYYESVGEDPLALMKHGEASSTYAGDDCTTLVTEVPYFFEPRIQSNKEMPLSVLKL